MTDKIVAFNSKRCWECPLQSTCEAGQLFEEIDNETADTAEGIVNFHKQNILPSIVDGTNPTETVDKLRDDIKKASERATQVRKGLETALAGLVNAQKLDDARQIELNDRAVETERIFDELSDVPHSTGSLETDGFKESMLAAASAVVRFAEQEVCLAATLE